MWMEECRMCKQAYLIHCAAASCSTESCARTWNRCGGFLRENGGRSRLDRRCCDPDSHCVQFSAAYAQCRPKKRVIPQFWSGEVLECGACSHHDVGHRFEITDGGTSMHSKSSKLPLCGCRSHHGCAASTGHGKGWCLWSSNWCMLWELSMLFS